MITIRCTNPDSTYTHSHADALEMKCCYAESAAMNADNPAEFRRFLGERDYARAMDQQFEEPIKF